MGGDDAGRPYLSQHLLQSDKILHGQEYVCNVKKNHRMITNIFHVEM